MCKKIVILIVLILTTLTGCTKKKENITVSVAISLQEPVSEIVEIYEKENDVTVNINSGSSGTLKKQIENGAEVDIFFSANEFYMNELVKASIVSKEAITYPVSNSLVLIKNNNSEGNINSIEELKNTNRSISLGEIKTVPVGQYAKQALENIGIFKTIQENIVYGKDATAVKSYVESGNVDLGIVYKSDAIDLENSSIIYEFPENTHEKIKYALAPIKYNEESKEIINLIKSEKGKEILKKHGFSIED